MSRSVSSSLPSKDILLKQERAVGLLVVGTFLPVLAVTVLSGSVLLFSDMLDYGCVFLASLMAWNVLRGIRLDKTHNRKRLAWARRGEPAICSRQSGGARAIHQVKKAQS